MSDFYQTSLKILIEFMKKNGYDNWVKWLETDIENWQKQKTTEHHLDAYGGMGSFNDVVIGDNSINGIWENKIFSTVQTLAYSFAKGRINEAPIEKEFYEFGSKELSGWKCRNCKHQRIGDYDIENYVANNLFAEIFVDYIKENKLQEIVDYQAIISSKKVKNKRKTISELIENSQILIDNRGWLWNCPKCQSKDVCVFRWEILENDSILAEAKNNLEMR